MPAPRGRFQLLLAIAAGLLAAGGAAFTYRNALFERWHLRMLHSKDPANWPIAAERLGELRSARAVPRLMEILRKTYREIPEGLDSPYGAALLEIGEPAAPALVDALGTSKSGLWHTVDTILLGIGRPAVPALAAALGEKGEWRRTHVLDLLERLGPLAGEAVPALILCLGDEAEPVSSRAANVLAAIGKEAREAIPALLRNLEHPRPPAARAAALALRRIDPENPSVTSALGRSLNVTEDPQSRILFASVLARIDPSDTSAVPALVKVLEEKYPSEFYEKQVRSLALWSLAELGTRAQAAIPFLEGFLRKGELREETEAALKSIDPQAERSREKQ